MTEMHHHALVHYGTRAMNFDGRHELTSVEGPFAVRLESPVIDGVSPGLIIPVK